MLLFWFVLRLATGGEALTEAFPPPDGATRQQASPFGDWLLKRQVLGPDQPIRTHSGAIVDHNGRVVELELVSGDLQQCADSAIRLRAEWLREQGKPVAFHATSGDLIPWQRYRDGETPYEQGGRLQWKPASPGSWNGYLQRVFMWAGTRSLRLDTVAAKEPRAGDLLVIPGSPGHAVVLLDVAKRGDELFVLIGEGYMPAQQFHVELGPYGGWWSLSDGVVLQHWDMREADLRRWKP
jgi:hypothetical protein